jgi:hypothetical protein
MLGPNNVPMDFVLGELIVGTDDQAKLDAFMARWGGSLLSSTEKVGDQTRLHQVKLDPSAAQVNQILSELQGKAPELKGSFKTSTDAAAKLLAVALFEANKNGFMVSPNFVGHLDGIAEGSTTEAPSSPDSLYSPNAFNWPYMNRGSPQDIGVGAAWQVLQRAGKLNNKVKIMVLDGGFVPSADFPAVRSVVGDWNTPSLLQCVGGACPWHGTMVTTAAMGQIDDSFGGAGPAAPVAELLAVPFQSDFFALFFTLERIVSATVFGNPRIINMSFGFELDLGWDIAVKASCLGLCPSPSEVVGAIMATVAATNKLIFASAGNSNKDVDNGSDVIEGSTHIPCELAGVICVGGMGHNVTARDSGSNFGSKTGDSTVDIYGPYWTYVGPDPDNTANVARLVPGTSFSSPFVAGVAALVWAANPSLSAGGVWEILRDTAHVGGVGTTGNGRRVNAFGAVARVLGGSVPTVALSGGATSPLNREWAITALVNDPEYNPTNPCPPSACALTWSPAPTRIVGNTAYYRFNTVGNRTVTATAQDLVGQTTSANRSVEVINSAPVVSISQPTAGSSVPQGIAIQLLGSATDLNEGPDPGPGSIACTWTSSNTADAGFPKTGCNTTATFSSTGNRTLTLSATDPQGLSATPATVLISVSAPPSNNPPTITLGSLPPTNYGSGYAWDGPIGVSASATDPEGNTPISFTWKATSLRPNSSTVYASNVVIAGPSASANLNWTPQNNPSLLGDFAQFGNDCYDGQIVRLVLEATDSLGNRSTRALPDIRVYRCILI